MLNYKNNNLVDVKKITLFSVFLFVLSSCANKIPLNSFEQEVPKPAPNYSNMDHWAAHPDKSDYSDLKPKNLVVFNSSDELRIKLIDFGTMTSDKHKISTSVHTEFYIDKIEYDLY